MVELNNFSFKESDKIKELLRAVLNIEHVCYKNKFDQDDNEDIDLNSVQYLFYS